MGILDLAIAVLVAAGLGFAFTLLEAVRQRRASRRALASSIAPRGEAAPVALESAADAEAEASWRLDTDEGDERVLHHLFLSPASPVGANRNPSASGAGAGPSTRR